MGETTAISWTDHTFNPWWGCMKVGPGCDFCYAEAWDRRTVGLEGQAHWGAGAPRRFFGDKHWNNPRRWNRKAEAEGQRRRVFCASMADVFDNEVEQQHRERLWQLIRETPSLDWQLVTKRIGNAAKMLPADWGAGYSNVWLIATVVNQEEADRDIPKLLETPARIRGLSVEPMLGPIDLARWVHPFNHNGCEGPCCETPRGLLHWVICGGESKQPGGEPRPMLQEWASDLRFQCQRAKCAFHFKQPGHALALAWGLRGDNTEPNDWPHGWEIQEFPE